MSKLIPQTLLNNIPDLYETEGFLNPTCYVKLFTPDSNWTWWVLEYDGEDTFFAMVHGHEKELGYVSISELESVKGPMGLKVERDKYFTPKRYGDIEELNDKTE